MSQEETPVDRMNRLLGKALTPLSLAYCKTETDMVQECLKNPILSETEGCIDAYKQMKDCFNWLYVLELAIIHSIFDWFPLLILCPSGIN